MIHMSAERLVDSNEFKISTYVDNAERQVDHIVIEDLTGSIHSLFFLSLIIFS